MHILKRLLGRSLVSEYTACRIAQLAAYLVAIGILVLAIRKIATLQLTEAEFFFGLIQVLSLVALIVCGGTLARIEAELTRKDNSH